MTALNQIINILDHIKLDNTSPVELADDPVALACCSYRMSQTMNTRYFSFEHCVVEPQDRVKAQQLCSYYREKTQDVLFAMLSSSGTRRPVSDFRRKLRLLVTDGLAITAREIGMLYRLPYLYHEDLALDQVTAATVSAIQRPAATKITSLRPLTKYLRSRRTAEVMQYWWAGVEDHEAYVLAVKRDNPLLSMIDDMFELSVLDLRFTNTVHCNLPYHENFHYNRIINPRMAACLIN